MSRLCGALWPDVINGLSFIEELDTPNTIEGQWTLEKTVTLDDLVAQHGAEAVMEAAGGELPQTPAQVRVVADKLNAQPA
jgi:hypothetical protein